MSLVICEEQKMKAIKKSRAAILCLSVVLQSAPAFAVPVTVAGTNVSFTYDSALTSLFGTPVVTGDSFYFTPTSFKAESYNGVGIDSTSVTFNVSVVANDGYFISSTLLSEEGDYYKLSESSAVAVGGQLIVRDLDAPLSSMMSSITSAMPLDVTTSFADFETTNWSATASLVLPEDWGPVAGVNVTLENILLASTVIPASAAFIEKKFVGLTVIASMVSPVPETNHYGMLLAGLGLVGFMVRRKKPLIKIL